MTQHMPDQMPEKTKLELDLEKIRKKPTKEPSNGNKLVKDLPLIILIIAMLAGWFLLGVEHVNHNATKDQLTEITAKYEDLKSHIDNSTLKTKTVRK